MKTSDIQKIIKIATTFSGYNEEPKQEFHRLAKRYLKEIARLMELPEGSYDVRSNKAGIACLGEVTLHGENIYVQLGGSMPHANFFYRTCKGRRDYTGGANQWMFYTKLTDMGAVAETFLKANHRSFASA